MVATSDLKTQHRFAELMRSGQVAYAAGKRRLAHDLWRRAATLAPYNEQVWLALLQVLDDEDDRRGCLQNIVAINPNNLQAQHQLRAYLAAPTQPLAPASPASTSEPRPSARRITLRIIEALALGTLLGIALSIVLYAF
jgi:ferric-dicitrate binding protein FerR (iron transport regulator)